MKPSLSARTANAAGHSTLFLAKTTVKAGWAITKLVGRQTSKLGATGGKAVKEYAATKHAEYELRRAEYTPNNFFEKGAATLEDLIDALLNENPGARQR